MPTPTGNLAYDITINNQAVTNASQLPVVYTLADGTKVYPQGDGSFKDATGKIINPAATPITASMNSATGSTTTPTKLSNVAPAAITATSNDAVNGSQLYQVAVNTSTHLGGGSTVDGNGNVTAPTYNLTAGNPSTGATKAYTNVGDALTGLDTAVNQPLTFAGDTGSELNRKLGSKVNVKGGAMGTLTTGNIGVVADGTDTLNVQLAKDVNLGTDGTLTTGDTTVNNAGVTINNGAAGQPVTLIASGLNNGGNKITNVAMGSNDTDAVNVSQLKTAAAAATTKVEGTQGVNVTANTPVNADGSTTYTVAAKTDNSTIKVDNNGNLTAVTSGISTSAAGDSKANTPTALTTAGEVANAINNSGWNLQANGDTATLVKPSNTVQFLDGKNINITRQGNDLKIATADDVNFNSVTANAITTSGLTVKSGSTINLGGNKVNPTLNTFRGG